MECGLELHPNKTKIVYCKDWKRKGEYPNTSFDFLGYTFCLRSTKNRKQNKLFVSFNPAVSKAAQKAMRARIRKEGTRNRTDLSLNEIAEWNNPVLRGWINYYGRYNRSALYPVVRHFNRTLVAWAMRKFKKFRRRKTKAMRFIENISKRQPHLFAHWKVGLIGGFA